MQRSHGKNVGGHLDGQFMHFEQPIVVSMYLIRSFVLGQYGQTGHHATLLHLASLHDLFGQLDTYIKKYTQTGRRPQSKGEMIIPHCASTPFSFY